MFPSFRIFLYAFEKAKNLAMILNEWAIFEPKHPGHTDGRGACDIEITQ